MAKTANTNAPNLGGWVLGVMVAIVAFGVAMVVGGLGMMPAAAIGAVLFVVVGLIAGMPRAPLPGPGETVITPARAPTSGGAVKTAAILVSVPTTPAPAYVPVAAPVAAPVAVAMAEPVVVPVAAAPEVAPAAFVSTPAPTGATGTAPQRLTAARGGVADDLKEIEGIGPALEKLCNELGFYHFDQIAGWTDADAAWVDDNMPRFKGRIERDKWVAQARLITSEGLEAFRVRAKTNDY